jgi:hypothetical protein
MEPRFSSLVASASIRQVLWEACISIVSKLDVASAVNMAVIGLALAFIGAIVAGVF